MKMEGKVSNLESGENKNALTIVPNHTLVVDARTLLENKFYHGYSSTTTIR